ncbi:SRPBCC family protein [bacterium]|nr:MAG: SRPBCC family protein [bacterium]
MKRTQVIRSPLAKVFEFFESPENLSIITPPWLRFVIKTPLPIDMRSGTVIEYTIRWLGIPVRWKTKITDYEPPLRFVDEQITGPYSLWHHTHVFRETKGMTEMTDTVRYRLPFGIFGQLVHWLLVHRQLQKIFDFRYRAIETIFNSIHS